MRTVYLGLGSNLGNRLGNLQAALRLLDAVAPTRAVSPLWETPPVGPEGQPPYWNAATRVDTALAPRALLQLVKRVEWLMGRRPGQVWGPRPLDIDILLIDGEGDSEGNVVDEPDLVIPHPRIVERAFVLVPLAAIAGDATHPVLRRTMNQLRATVDDEGLTQIAGPDWRTARYL